MAPTELHPTADPSVSARDDDFHPPPDHHWATETCWFSFFVPERAIGGWLYIKALPNVGVCQGGAWVWDDTGYLPWECRAYANYSATRFDLATSDLRDFHGSQGVQVRAVEPLRRYELGYADDGFRATLSFDALHEPHVLGHGEPPFLAADHFDQLGRVTGEIVLDGETIAVDCVAMRDRSWGLRSERRAARIGYAWAGAADLGWLTYSGDTARGGGLAVDRGYLWRDGRLARLTGGRRIEARDPEHGWLTGLTVEAVDTEGRELHATARAVSRLVIPHPIRICWATLLAWDLDGRTVWGEDQDVWPNADWAAARRSRSVDDL